jgi:FkbM family methyltransferase
MSKLAHYAQRLRSHPRPVRFLLSRVLWRSGACRLLNIDCGRYRLRFFPSSLSADYWVDPRDRAHEEEFLTRYLRPGDTVIDVGANLGALSLLASALVGPAGRVFSIEAHPRIFGFLVGNVELNRSDNIRAIHSAVGDHEGTVSFSDRRSDDQNAIEEAGALTVPLTTLDRLVPAGDAPAIALLKIDVEGYERFVLAGAEGVLARTGAVFFESWDPLAERFGYTAGELVRWMGERGWSVYRLGADTLTRLDEGARSPQCENLIAVRDAAAFLARYGGEVVAGGRGERVNG